MTGIEYFIYCINSEKIWRKRKFYYKLMGLPGSENESNEYYSIKDGYYYVNVDGESHKITDRTIDVPLVDVSDKVELSKLNLVNITDKQKSEISRVGIVIINKLMMESVFGNRLTFINGKIKNKTIEKFISNGLIEDEITVTEYKKYILHKGLVETFSRLVTISGTKKGLLPPDGINEYKIKLSKELAAKHGEDWDTNFTYIAEYEAAVKKYDDEYLSDDPANNKYISGKVKNEARRKLYLSFGAELGFNKTATRGKLIKGSLKDGYPKDKEQLTTMFNTARSGLYDRGSETQQGGVVAKDSLRATSSIKLNIDDCKTKETRPVTITKDNAGKYRRRNIVVKGKIVSMDNPEDYIGKRVDLRTPIYCLGDKKGATFCKVCAGNLMRNYETGVSLLISDIAGIILNTAMKSMHSSSITNVPIDFVSFIE